MIDKGTGVTWERSEMPCGTGVVVGHKHMADDEHVVHMVRDSHNNLFGFPEHKLAQAD